MNSLCPTAFSVMFGCCLLVACSFRKGNGERVDPGEKGGGGELEGVVGWETVIGIICKKNLFSIK